MIQEKDQEKDLLKQVPNSEVVFIMGKPTLPSLDGKGINPLIRCRVILRRKDNGKMKKELKAIYVGSEKPSVYTFEDTNSKSYFRLSQEAIDQKAVSLLNEPDLSLLDND